MLRGRSFSTYTPERGVGESSAMRVPVHCCHSDVIICAYRIVGWVLCVWNPKIYAHVQNVWPLRNDWAIQTKLKFRSCSLLFILDWKHMFNSEKSQPSSKARRRWHNSAWWRTFNTRGLSRMIAHMINNKHLRKRKTTICKWKDISTYQVLAHFLLKI